LCRDINGIQVLHSTDITVSGNQIWENNGLEWGGDGINLGDSQFVTVANNQIMANWNGGITCTNSSRNQLIGNVVTRNWHNGINLVSGSDYNLIALNHLFNHSTNSRGAVCIENSRNNYLVANNLTDNGCWAIQLTGEQGNNTFYGNNFMNNSYRNIRRTPGALQISTPGTTNGNSWDNSSYGNYWSDYGGSDANGDGIGDSPYYINPTNQDNYPLVNPVATSKVPLIASQLPPSMFSSPESPAQQLPVIAVAVSASVAVAAVIYLKERKPSGASQVKEPMNTS
jgi:parallel beta-helix repeat protein